MQILLKIKDYSTFSNSTTITTINHPLQSSPAEKLTWPFSGQLSRHRMRSRTIHSTHTCLYSHPVCMPMDTNTV